MHILTPSDYVENASLPFEMFDNTYNIGVFGTTRSGKSNWIANYMQHFMLHKCSADSVYIFSPSFNTDSTYASCRDYL